MSMLDGILGQVVGSALGGGAQGNNPLGSILGSLTAWATSVASPAWLAARSVAVATAAVKVEPWPAAPSSWR